MPEQFVDEDRVIDVDRLNRLLRQGHPDVEVVAVRELDASEGSASRVRLAVEYAPAADAGLPPTMFLKRNLARFGFPGEMYSTEVRLYRDVLPGLPIETPAIYAVESAPDDVRFTLLMEDLGARPGARLGIVTEPTTPDEAASVLDTLVVLHAAYWGGDRLARELLRHYLDGLTAAGVAAPSFDEAWLRYRQNVLYGVLMWLITPDGVHTD